MLHSTLPRAFLTPGLKYLSSYYGDDVTPYQTTTSYPGAQFEEHYPRIPEHHVFPTWHTVQRSASPCPLDLSLKPSKSEKDIHEDPKLQEDADRDRRRIRSYNVLDVEEDRDHEESIGDRNRGDDERGQLILHDDGEDKVEVDRDDVRIGIYPEEEVRLQHSPRYQKIPLQNTASSLHLQSTVPGYHHQHLLMTPQHHLQGINAPMTPPSTPSPPQCPRKRQRDELGSSSTGLGTTSPSGNNTSRNSTPGEKQPRPKKKHARRLKFDEDTSSPVSGTVILGPDEAVVTGDIDPAFNVVEVTEEARAELAKIENRLGPYQCRLCRQLHDDAFQLAQHRCSRIAHVEYRCPECDKRFSCPANLASHRRWHKPRVPAGENTTSSSIGATGQTTLATNTNEFSCTRCDAKFSRQAALRKHVASQHSEIISNSGNGNGNGNGNNDRNSAGSNTSGSTSLVGNIEQVSNHVGSNHLGISTLSVEMP